MPEITLLPSCSDCFQIYLHVTFYLLVVSCKRKFELPTLVHMGLSVTFRSLRALTAELLKPHLRQTVWND